MYNGFAYYFAVISKPAEFIAKMLKEVYMLKEKTVFKEELPIDVVVADIEEYPTHFHDNMEIIYVLDGTVKLKSGHYEYLLKKGDVFIVNEHEIHSLTHTGEGNMTMMLTIDSEYFSRYYDNFRSIYFVSNPEKDAIKLSVIRSLLGRIMMELLQKGYGYEHKVIETTHNLLSNLISELKNYRKDEDYQNNSDIKAIEGRLNRITEYMCENYDRKLTLNEIAERENLSIYYLSHAIKESTGLSFQDLLSYIRVEESEDLLLNTNDKIGTISQEMGFSAVRYYIKHFETWHGMHPLEYREKYTGKGKARESKARYKRSAPEDIDVAITNLTSNDYMTVSRSTAPAPEVIDVNVSNELSADTINASDLLVSFLERNNLKFIARPHNLINSLSEDIVSAGENYMITAVKDEEGEITNISILVYNFDKEVREKLMNSTSEEDDYETVRNYDKNAEFLIRFVGLSGEFNISRYLQTRENVVVAYDTSYQAGTKREELLNNWKTLPMVEFGTLAVSDTLSLSVNLTGLSSELILIDKNV